MKVKNIVFTGFMAAILSAGAAQAAGTISVASQGYVDHEIETNVTNVSFADDNTKYLGSAKGLKAAAVELDKQVNLNAEAINLLGGDAGAEGVKDLVANVDANKEAIERLDGGADEKDSVLNKITTAIGDLMGNVTGDTGVVKTISQTNGIITAERAAIVDADIADDAKISQSKIDGLSASLDAKADADSVYTKDEANSTFATAEQGQLAASALQADDIATGETDGTIKVGETEVAVKGLGSAAYTDSDAYATAEQGTKAASALQQADVTTGEANGTIKVKGAEVAVAGLKSAAYSEASVFETAGAAEAVKTELTTELSTKISKPAACDLTNCVLSLSKVDGKEVISWVPLIEP